MATNCGHDSGKLNLAGTIPGSLGGPPQLDCNPACGPTQHCCIYPITNVAQCEGNILCCSGVDNNRSCPEGKTCCTAMTGGTPCTKNTQGPCYCIDQSDTSCGCKAVNCLSKPNQHCDTASGTCVCDKDCVDYWIYPPSKHCCGADQQCCWFRECCGPGQQCCRWDRWSLPHCASVSGEYCTSDDECCSGSCNENRQCD
jgi:hypothetical protein